MTLFESEDESLLTIQLERGDLPRARCNATYKEVKGSILYVTIQVKNCKTLNTRPSCELAMYDARSNARSRA